MQRATPCHCHNIFPLLSQSDHLGSVQQPRLYVQRSRDPGSFRKSSLDWPARNMEHGRREHRNRLYGISTTRPGQVFQKTFTLAIEPRSEGRGHSDIYNLEVGKTYELTIRRQKWWWRFEDDMPSGHSDDQRKEFLFAQSPTEWRPENTIDFVSTD